MYYGAYKQKNLHHHTPRRTAPMSHFPTIVRDHLNEEFTVLSETSSPSFIICISLCFKKFKKNILKRFSKMHFKIQSCSVDMERMELENSMVNNSSCVCQIALARCSSINETTACGSHLFIHSHEIRESTERHCTVHASQCI